MLLNFIHLRIFFSLQTTLLWIFLCGESVVHIPKLENASLALIQEITMCIEAKII